MRVLCWTACLCVLTPWWGAAAVQEQKTPDPVPQTAAPIYIGRPIADVRVLVEGRQSDDPSFRDLLETHAGEPLAMADVRESIAHLYTLGRFQDIRVNAAAATGGGVSLEFDLVPIHTVERIEFRGTLGLSEGDLRRAVADRYGASPPIGRAADMATMLERFYRDRGFLSASVRPVAEERHAPDRTILTFEIQSGPQARIGGARLIGEIPTPQPELFRDLRASAGDPYQPPELQRRLGEYLTRLRQRGYPAKSFAREALTRLSCYDWPGNVRELENLVEQLVVTTPGPVIRPEDLPQHIVATQEEPFTLDFDLARPLQPIIDELTERIERTYLRRVLEQYRGRIDACARHCGLSRRSISEKLRRYQIDKADFKAHPPRGQSIVGSV